MCPLVRSRGCTESGTTDVTSVWRVCRSHREREHWSRDMREINSSERNVSRCERWGLKAVKTLIYLSWVAWMSGLKLPRRWTDVDHNTFPRWHFPSTRDLLLRRLTASGRWCVSLCDNVNKNMTKLNFNTIHLRIIKHQIWFRYYLKLTTVLCGEAPVALRWDKKEKSPEPVSGLSILGYHRNTPHVWLRDPHTHTHIYIYFEALVLYFSVSI